MMAEENTVDVHPKVWGEEHWIVNKSYCGKMLILNRGFRCSIHWHEFKDEVFYVAGGRVPMEVNGACRVLVRGPHERITASFMK